VTGIRRASFQMFARLSGGAKPSSEGVVATSYFSWWMSATLLPTKHTAMPA
jgi:hypothetical protein